MAHVIIKLKVMPEGTDIDLEQLDKDIQEKIVKFGANYKGTETEPVAFGLKALNFTFSMDESLGDTEELEKDISNLKRVSSVAVTGCSRALG